MQSTTKCSSFYYLATRQIKKQPIIEYWNLLRLLWWKLFKNEQDFQTTSKKLVSNSSNSLTALLESNCVRFMTHSQNILSRSPMQLCETHSWSHIPRRWFPICYKADNLGNVWDITGCRCRQVQLRRMWEVGLCVDLMILSRWLLECKSGSHHLTGISSA